MSRTLAALSAGLLLAGLLAGAAPAAAGTHGARGDGGRGGLVPLSGSAARGPAASWAASAASAGFLTDLHTGPAPGAIRALSALARGQDSGGVLLGDPAPVKMDRGVSVTLAVTDVDGDGDEELLQFRGTPVAPTLVVVDGVAGAVLWTYALPTYQFSLRLVPAPAGGTDVLLFVPAGSWRMIVLSGTTGETRWSRPVNAGQGLLYYGTTQGAGGTELLTGRYEEPGLLQTSLTLESRSLQTGAITGTTVVLGQGTYPTAGPTRDVDNDGVSDLLTLEPQRAFGTGAAAGGVVRAVSRRTGTQLWSTVVAQGQVDDVYLVDAADVNADGTDDALLLFEWLGNDGQTPSFHNITVVDGRGGNTAGLQPMASVDLQHVAWELRSPGDVNGDGGAELLSTGPMYSFSGEGLMVLEAIGRSGRLYTAVASYPVTYADYAFGWWSDAGDLDGDGSADYLALLGSRSAGPQVAVALSVADGSQLWRREGLAGGFSAPTWADGDGDGGDEVVSVFNGDHPTSSTTRFTFTVADGRTLDPLWAHERTVDAGGNGFTIYLSGGSLRGADHPDDVVVEYLFNAGYGRHFTDVLDAGNGAVRWTKP